MKQPFLLLRPGKLDWGKGKVDSHLGSTYCPNSMRNPEGLQDAPETPRRHCTTWLSQGIMAICNMGYTTTIVLPGLHMETPPTQSLRMPP